VVRSGDSLWDLAVKFYGDGNRYDLIANANRIDQSNRIKVGMQIKIPALPPAIVMNGRGIEPQAGVAPKPGYPILPDGLDQVRKVFGNFRFSEVQGGPPGRIQIDPKWVSVNIVTVMVPLLGTIQCHKLLAPVFVNVFKTLQAQKLGLGLKYYGCYVARHKMWNRTKGLSTHSWGIALDLNADTNAVGTAGTMDPRIIQIFAEHGFYWGGNFGDPMHFQYCVGY
jgi:hypothetical protein